MSAANFHPAEPIVIDGRRAKATQRRQAERHGLDFPLAGGRTVRLPYPAPRFRPAGPHPDAPDDPNRVRIESRIGYPARIDELVAKFHHQLDDPSDPVAIFAAAVVCAWALLTYPPWTGQELTPMLPADAFDFSDEDAAVFIARMYRLTAGLVDLEMDDEGNYLLVIPRGADDVADVADPTATLESESEPS